MAKIKGLTKELAARFRELSQVPTQRYFPDAEFKALIAEEWEALEPIKTENGDWHWVTCTHDKDTYRFQTHRNKILNPDEPIKIMKFICKEDFKASNNKTVLAGTEKFVAMQG